MPKLSVITPIYNSEKYLDKCLNSLVSQTLQDIELIWIDNGSNDACRRIIKAYQQRRPQIKVIHLEHNIGYGPAMNLGISQACGDYIGFCDSDDWVDDDYYEKLYNTALPRQSDIAYTTYTVEVNGASLPVKHLVDTVHCHTLAEKLSSLKNGAIWDKIFKTDLFKHHHLSFPEDLKSYYEDNILLIQAITFAQDIALTDSAQYHYVQHEKSTVHNAANQTEREHNRLLVAAYILNFAIQNHFSTAEKLLTLDFADRSLCLSSAISNQSSYSQLCSLLKEDSSIQQHLQKLYRRYNPTLLKKIFSYQKINNQKILYLMGIKIKL